MAAVRKATPTKPGPVAKQSAPVQEEPELDDDQPQVVKEPSAYVKHIQAYKADPKHAKVPPAERQKAAIASWRELNPKATKPASDYQKYYDEVIMNDTSLAGKSKKEKKAIISVQWRKEKDLKQMERMRQAKQASAKASPTTNGTAKKEGS